jgi:Zn-finger nucleic acid-binding protein
MDGRELSPFVLGGCALHTCESCGGELIPSEALKSIVQARESFFGEHWSDVVSATMPPTGVADKTVQRGVSCPVCAARMQTTLYMSETPVHLEHCLACGANWLDSTELEHVQSLLESWETRAPAPVRALQLRHESERQMAVSIGETAFQVARFRIVSALMNRLLDAA